MGKLSYHAGMWARDRHKNQVRKYKGNQYFDHLAEVGFLVYTLGLDDLHVSTAILHDSIEDQNATMDDFLDISKSAGYDVVIGCTLHRNVDLLSERPLDGNRKMRKKKYRERLSVASPEIQTIKTADIHSNAQTMRFFDPNFWKLWRNESIDMLESFDNIINQDFYDLTMELLKK